MHLQLAPVRVGQLAEGLLVARGRARGWRRSPVDSPKVCGLLVHGIVTPPRPKFIAQFADPSGVCTGMTSKQKWILVLAALAAFMTALDTLVVTTALSTIRAISAPRSSELEWTVNAYNLSFAVLLMTAAALGDRYGRRRLFADGHRRSSSLASAACALAPSVGALIAARAVQGVGAAMVTTLALALVSAAFPPERRGAALGIFFAVNGLAVAGGPLVGGAVTEGIAWEWIFWLNVPIGLALIPLVLTRIPESHGPDSRVDLPGLAWSARGVFGWSGGWCAATAPAGQRRGPRRRSSAGVVLLAAFVPSSCAPGRRCCRCGSSARAPSRPATRRSSARSARSSARVFFMSQFLQVGLGYGPLGAGLRLLPWTATLFFVAPVAGKLVDRFGERRSS